MLLNTSVDLQYLSSDPCIHVHEQPFESAFVQYFYRGLDVLWSERL